MLTKAAPQSSVTLQRIYRTAPRVLGLTVAALTLWTGPADRTRPLSGSWLPTRESPQERRMSQSRETSPQAFDPTPERHMSPHARPP